MLPTNQLLIYAFLALVFFAVTLPMADLNRSERATKWLYRNGVAIFEVIARPIMLMITFTIFSMLPIATALALAMSFILTMEYIVRSAQIELGDIDKFIHAVILTLSFVIVLFYRWRAGRRPRL